MRGAVSCDRPASPRSPSPRWRSASAPTARSSRSSTPSSCGRCRTRNADRLVRVTADFTGAQRERRRPVAAGVARLSRSQRPVRGDRRRVGDQRQPDRDRSARAGRSRCSRVPSYFDVLGVRPQLGRLFGPEDTAPGITEVARASATRSGAAASARRPTRSAASCASTTTGTPSSACCRRDSVIRDDRC